MRASAAFILFFLFYHVIATKISIRVPVVLLDYDHALAHIYEDPNPFSRMSTYRFSDIIHDSMRRCGVVIIFVEDFLSNEDLSSKDGLGTPYHYLHQGLIGNQVRYFPAVTEPYEVLNQIFPKVQQNVFRLQTHTKLYRLDGLKYIYIFFDDSLKETRAERLRRHDLIIREVCFVVRQLGMGPVAGFYTGITNPNTGASSNFIPIKPLPIPRESEVMVVSSGAMFRFTGVYGATSTRRFNFNQLPLVAQELFTRRSMKTKMAYSDFEIEFNFNFQETGWIIEHVALLEAGEEVGRTEMGVGAPWNWSYVCGEPLIIVNTRDGSSVTISQYQIQPRLTDFRRYADGQFQLMQAAKNVAQCFGKSVNCGPYFNSNILTGLMITFIMLAITMYGVVSLFNCVSNDKFDDPNAKPLVFEAR